GRAGGTGARSGRGLEGGRTAFGYAQRDARRDVTHERVAARPTTRRRRRARAGHRFDDVGARALASAVLARFGEHAHLVAREAGTVLAGALVADRGAVRSDRAHPD